MFSHLSLMCFLLKACVSLESPAHVLFGEPPLGMTSPRQVMATVTASAGCLRTPSKEVRIRGSVSPSRICFLGIHGNCVSSRIGHNQEGYGQSDLRERDKTVSSFGSSEAKCPS